jgi:glycosyltransferase involved in cell wall biosynthesis
MERIDRLHGAGDPVTAPFSTASRRNARDHSRDKRLVVIIPCLNERDSIAAVMTKMHRMFPVLSDKGIRASVYVIDDGSTDCTGAVALAAGAERVVRHRVNLGLGAAVRTGIRTAREDDFDIVVKLDADGQHDPEDIPPLIEPILRDEADVVYGDRFDRISYRMPFVRRIGNQAFSSLMRWLTGWPLRDSQPGIFAVNRDYLAVCHLPGDYNYTQQLLLDAYHKNMRFTHVDVSFCPRETGASFISWRYPFRVIPQLLLVIAFVKPMRIFAPIGLIFFALAASTFCFQTANWLLGNADKPVANVNLVLGALLFGVQTLFFGMLAQLIVQTRR